MPDCASSGFSSEGTFRISFRSISITARLLNLTDSLQGQLSNQKGKIRLDIATGNEHPLYFGVIMYSTRSLLRKP